MTKNIIIYKIGNPGMKNKKLARLINLRKKTSSQKFSKNNLNTINLMRNSVNKIQYLILYIKME
jgi:hypothetical protein